MGRGKQFGEPRPCAGGCGRWVKAPRDPGDELLLEDGVTVVQLVRHAAFGMCPRCYQKRRDSASGRSEARLRQQQERRQATKAQVLAPPVEVLAGAEPPEFVPKYGLTAQEAVLVQYIQRRFEPVRRLEFLRMLGLFTSRDVYEDDLSAAVRAMNHR